MMATKHAAKAVSPVHPRESLLEIGLIKPGRYFLEGELSFASVEQALKKTATMFSAEGRLVFDLSGIAKVDSAGLALLLEWRRWARQADIAIHYANLPRQLLAIAHVAGVDDILITD